MTMRKYAKRLAPVGLAIALLAGQATAASANTLTSVSLGLSNSAPSAPATYTFTVSNVSNTALQCVIVEFDDNASAVPTGMTHAAPTFGGTLADTASGWTVDASVPGTIKASGAASAAPSASGRTLTIAGITNGSVANTQYVATVTTYSNGACTTVVDSGAAAFTYTPAVTVEVVVDPTLTFTVAGRPQASACNGESLDIAASADGTSVNLGRVNTSADKTRAQDLTVASNAVNGFSVLARQTDTNGLWNGASEIAPVSGAANNATPVAWPTGEAFGYTTDDATLGGADTDRFTDDASKWAPLTETDQAVSYQAAGPTPELGTSQCVAYKVGVSATTPAGEYNVTVIYTAVPVF